MPGHLFFTEFRASMPRSSVHALTAICRVGSPSRWSPTREIGAMEATRLINRRNALMLDVREPKEYEGGRVPNAMHLPGSQLASRGQELRKLTGRPVIAYCDRGQRSRAAAAALAKLGFTEVYTLRGGLRAWSDAGLPVDKGA